jgi:hypothetical protein
MRNISVKLSIISVRGWIKSGSKTQFGSRPVWERICRVNIGWMIGRPVIDIPFISKTGVEYLMLGVISTIGN